MDLLIPAYANPCCDQGPRMWSTLASTARTSGVQLHIILNPASGPGASPIDANYIGVDGTTGPLIDLLVMADQKDDPTQQVVKLYGYVTTGYGARAIVDIHNDIDRYYSDPLYWRGNTATNSSSTTSSSSTRTSRMLRAAFAGIFFDELSSDPATIPLYTALRSYIQTTHDPNAYVWANPGVPVAQEFFNAPVADTIVTFEQTALAYTAITSTWQQEGEEWTTLYDPKRFAHLIHTMTTTTTSNVEEQLKTIVDLAQSRNVGFLYVTDDPYVDLEHDNPWDSLPTFWDALVEAVAAQANTDGSDCAWEWFLQLLWDVGLGSWGDLLDGVVCGSR